MAKLQGENGKLVGISLEIMDVLLGALDNTLDCSFAEETRSEEFQ